MVFVGLSVLFPGESKPQDFCDTILSFDEDPDGICAQKFKEQIRNACITHEPQISEEQCLSQVTLLLVDDCINTEQTLGIDKNICLYKKMKNFEGDLERWLK